MLALTGPNFSPGRAVLSAAELMKHDDMSVGWPAGGKESSLFVCWLPSVGQLGSRFDLRAADG